MEFWNQPDTARIRMDPRTQQASADDVRIIDGFLSEADFASLRKRAGDADYAPIRHGALEYAGLSRDEQVDPAALFDRFGMAVRPRKQFFRKYDSGVIQHTFIHSDIGLGDWAAILSLPVDGQDNGQFALWRHKATGWTEPDPSDPDGVAQTEADGLTEDKWDCLDRIPLPPNRCIVLPAARFHSRYPRDWPHPWPRRIEVFFFDRISGQAHPGTPPGPTC